MFYTIITVIQYLYVINYNNIQNISYIIQKDLKFVIIAHFYILNLFHQMIVHRSISLINDTCTVYKSYNQSTIRNELNEQIDIVFVDFLGKKREELSDQTLRIYVPVTL